MNKHLHPKNIEVRQFRAVCREQSALWREQHALPPVPLAEPYQGGWERSFALTERSRQRRDSDILATILPEINTVQRCWNKNFTVNRRKRGKRRTLVFDQQGLRRIRAHRWCELRWPEEWKKRYFNLLPQPIAWLSRYEFAKPDVFELHLAPYWITETTARCPVIEQRLAQIDAWLQCRGGYRRAQYLNGTTMRKWLPPKSRQTLCADQSFKQQIADLRREGVIPETRHSSSPRVSALTPSGNLWTSSIKVMQRAFNARNRERYPGGLFISQSWASSIKVMRRSCTPQNGERYPGRPPRFGMG